MEEENEGRVGPDEDEQTAFGGQKDDRPSEGPVKDPGKQIRLEFD
jgi:hypothetical protein